ncbi:MAG: nucleotide exchange factor GrpE [Candidatus Terrybacteria bacterium]|nr:nucleotide exchange factor GrpE [Candidatus Terrybacteria bacterium]
MAEQDIREEHSDAGDRTELRDALTRLTADFENLRKDTQRMRHDARRFGISEAVRAMAAVYDTLRFAELHVSGHSPSLREGIEKIADQFAQGLKTLGVTRIPVEGSYDPKFHEAVEHISGVEAHTVAEEVGTGWMWQDNGEVIVPARVKVGAG